MPNDTTKTEQDCAKPVWANLFFVQGNKTLWNGSVGFHGLPRVGDIIEHTGHDLVDDVSLFGKVEGVRYGTTTDGSFKPTVWVEVSSGR